MTRSILDTFEADGLQHIKPLRTGGRGAPLFCFPGAGGGPEEFRQLAAFLPEGQPVYAVDMELLWQVEKEFTIEDLAPFYLELIRSIQRKGPYYLCGYSFGGLLAYEMARRLTVEGDDANLVALLDTPNPALISSLSTADAVQFHKTYLIDRIKKYSRMLVRLDLKGFVRSGLAFMVSRLGSYFLPAMKLGFRMVKRPLPVILGTHDPTTVFLKAWRGYLPKSYPKDVVFFRVQDRGPEYDRDPSMGWDSYVMGSVQVHIVPGGHLDMMRPPSVKVLAEKLSTYLDKGSNRSDSVSVLSNGVELS